MFKNKINVVDLDDSFDLQQSIIDLISKFDPRGNEFPQLVITNPFAMQITFGIKSY
jgi:hypothetical protein